MYEIATDLSRKIYEGVKFSDRDYSYDVLLVDDYYTNGRKYDYDFLTAQRDMAALVNTDVNGKPMQTVALVTVEQRDSREQSVEAFDAAHAASGPLLRDTNKENRSAQGTPAGNVPGGATRFSTVSISDFLRIVNST